MALAEKIPKPIILFVLSCVVIWAAWQQMFPSGMWRYRLIVEVETPEGIKTGSAVREVNVKRGWLLTPEMHVDVKVVGEAVVVDLGKRGVLFALLSSYGGSQDYDDQIVYSAFPFRGPTKRLGPLSRQGISYYSHLTDAKTVLEPGQYPKLIFFRNLKDPKTAEAVLEMTSDGRIPPNISIAKDRTEEFFGAGVRIKSISIEMTSDPVTHAVDSYLPMHDQTVWKYPGIPPHGDPGYVIRGYFSKGDSL